MENTDSTAVVPAPAAEDEYLLTIRVKFKAMDTIAARQETENLLMRHNAHPDRADMDVKLQKLVPGKPPEGIKI